MKRFKRDVAPVELNDLNEIPISKELERMQSGNTNLRDILSTPEQFNSERWMIKRCTGIRKALEKKERKGVCLIPKLELNPPEKKRTRNDELEAPLEYT